MTEKTAYKHDDNLLAQAKEVFGDDLVVDAFVTYLDYGYGSSVVKRRINEKLYKSPCLIGGQLDIYSKTIAIKFINGITVEFSSSEWASMERSGDNVYFV